MGDLPGKREEIMKEEEEKKGWPRVSDGWWCSSQALLPKERANNSWKSWLRTRWRRKAVMVKVGWLRGSRKKRVRGEMEERRKGKE